MAVLLPINPEHPEPRKIKRAVELLEQGAVIAYPTDTVYGLGCDLMNKQAIESLYQIKGMQRDKNLAFICPDLADIARYAVVENATYRVLKRFLPGPYCFVLHGDARGAEDRADEAEDGGHPRASNIRSRRRSCASSGGRSSARPRRLRARIRWSILGRSSERFSGLELVLDAGAGGTVPTTVVDLSDGSVRIVREGAGPIDDLV